MFDDKTQNRFWFFTPQLSKEECWIWEGFRNPAGYGCFSYKNDLILAHRYSLGLKLGRAIEHPMMACHTCDNPGCVNPHHLWEGTRSDNVRDAMKKGRFAPVPPSVQLHPKGEGHPFAKLNDEKVREIRCSPLSANELAEIYGVSNVMIRNVQQRKNWAHVI